MKSIQSLLLAIVFTAVMTGCHHQVQTAKTTPPPPQPKPAPSASINVSPENVQSGQSAHLSWNTENASTITIDGIGTVSASGSQDVTPQASTTYHLTAKGEGGTTEANARVTVSAATTATVKQPSDEELFAQMMKDVFFNYDKADIRDDGMNAIAADAQFLVQHPAIKLVIEGHCDERGSEEYNIALGQNRATDVRDALIKAGVSADRIKLISFGKERPFCTTAENESCWQQNRRAHFALQNQQRASN